MNIISKKKDNTVRLETIIPGNPFVIKHGGASPQYFMRVENASGNIRIASGWVPVVNLSTGVLCVKGADEQVEMIRMSVVQE